MTSERVIDISRRLIATIAVATVVLGCRTAAPRAGATDRGPALVPADRLDAARRSFYRAVDGDADALRECERLLGSADIDSSSAKVTAYRGACRMLSAAAAPLPWDKGRHARAGLTMLDRAVADTPDDLEVRFVRGMTSYHLPAFFGRSEAAAADLARVAAEAEAAAADGRLDRTLATAALFHYGELLRKRGEHGPSRDAWRRAAALGPDTRPGTAAMQALR